VIAVGGLAGLRSKELMRLDWADVWRVPGHIEITAGKSKTRQRRLVEICVALRAWLEPYRAHKIGKFWPGEERTFLEHYGELCETAKVTRKANGLRHAFCTYHFAAHANENQTAQQAGNSPAMIHAHYKGLATKAEAQKWFKVLPPKSAKNVIRLKVANNV
jgi:integrase